MTNPTDYLAALALLARDPAAARLFRCDIVNHGKRTEGGRTENGYPSDSADYRAYGKLQAAGLLSHLSWRYERARWTPSELALEISAEMALANAIA